MIRRNISGVLVEALSDTPVVFLQGPRQSGKSTLARAIASKDGNRAENSMREHLETIESEMHSDLTDGDSREADCQHMWRPTPTSSHKRHNPEVKL